MEGSAERAQAIHDNVVRMHQETGDEEIAPTVVSYNTLVSAWTKVGNPQRAEQVMQEMLQAPSHMNLKPDSTTFCHLINGYSSVMPRPNITRALELVELMDELKIEKTFYIYGALQNAHARSQRPDAPMKSKELLDEMVKEYEQGNATLVKPTVVNFNTVLNACSRTPSVKAAKMATDLLERMKKPVEEGGYDIEPDRLSYVMTIYACASCPDARVGAPMAQGILDQMEEQAVSELRQQKDSQGMAPPRITLGTEGYNAVLGAWARSAMPASVNHCLNIVERMENLAVKFGGAEKIWPNRRSYNSVLNAMVRTSGTQYAQEKAKTALNMVKRMWKMDDDGKSFSKPDSYSYTALLILHQKSTTDPSAPSKVDDLIREMEERHNDGSLQNPPDVVHYTIAISTWARSRKKGTVQRCSQILLHMMDRHKAGFPNCVPNNRTYNAFIDALSRAREEERAEKVLYYMLDQYRHGKAEMAPDSFSFNSVLIAFTKSRRKGVGQRAESILDQLLQYAEEENTDVDPNERSFAIVINYYCRARLPDAPYRAEFLLNRMVDYCRTNGACISGMSSKCFTMVIEAYAMKRMPDGGERAERLLRVMKDLKKLKGSSFVKIDANVLHSVMLAWANSRDELAGQKAQYHLDTMERRFADGDESMRPTTRCYGIVLSAWTRSPLEGKANKALSILRRMEAQTKAGNKDVTFDPFAKSLVINACSFSNRTPAEESEAYRIAVVVFDEMIESTGPSHRTLSVTYGWFLQLCGRLSIADDEKDRHIERAFRKCCEQGLANDLVLSRLRGSARPALQEKLIGPAATDSNKSASSVRSKELPIEWTRNVSKRRDDDRILWTRPSF